MMEIEGIGVFVAKSLFSEQGSKQNGYTDGQLQQKRAIIHAQRVDAARIDRSYLAEGYLVRSVN